MQTANNIKSQLTTSLIILLHTMSF